jgi:hypothetical protein
LLVSFKGTVQREFSSLFDILYSVWIGLGLKMNRFWI